MQATSWNASKVSASHSFDSSSNSKAKGKWIGFDQIKSKQMQRGLLRQIFISNEFALAFISGLFSSSISYFHLLTVVLIYKLLYETGSQGTQNRHRQFPASLSMPSAAASHVVVQEKVACVNKTVGIIMHNENISWGHYQRSTSASFGQKNVVYLKICIYANPSLEDCINSFCPINKSLKDTPSSGRSFKWSTLKMQIFCSFCQKSLVFSYFERRHILARHFGLTSKTSVCHTSRLQEVVATPAKLITWEEPCKCTLVWSQGTKYERCSHVWIVR